MACRKGEIEIGKSEIRIDLKKKRELPLLLDYLKSEKLEKCSWMNKKNIVFNPTASS